MNGEEIMRFQVTAQTDIGISKNCNQDSMLVKHASRNGTEILLAVLCDGMGGLEQGELASASVIRAFEDWFKNDLWRYADHFSSESILSDWRRLLEQINERLLHYSSRHKVRLGTTCTAVLMTGEQLCMAHVGDSRLYYLQQGLQQITTDHTFVAEEVACGRLTREQAKKDGRRNMLTQCIGVLDHIAPQFQTRALGFGCYLLCSDGFRNEVTEEELLYYFSPSSLSGTEDMRSAVRTVVELVKQRGERDNISAILIRANEG